MSPRAVAPYSKASQDRTTTHEENGPYVQILGTETRTGLWPVCQAPFPGLGNAAVNKGDKSPDLGGEQRGAATQVGRRDTHKETAYGATEKTKPF